MSTTLSVVLVQPDIYWENPDANRAELEEMISEIQEPVDLIVLPETFSTGFTSRAKVFAEPQNLHTHKWMKQIAADKKAAVCGSILIKEGSKVYNRFLFVEPDGTTSPYNKRHLFSIGTEGEQFTAGQEIVTINWRGWRIRPFVCYDLRFPVWARNSPVHYDLAIYVANWPKVRMNVFNTLLTARAIENQAYTIGVNRVGEDENGITYNGMSKGIDPKGEIISELEDNPGLLQMHLSKTELEEFRKKFPVSLDADDFELRL
ncbi:amidohydrolase [Jiulongibacter sp. NS-SX5]|uniref:amidohydrolase n=1 Tax=Jiulongibacter sp. NS-SX5 TaxID=3463854 RepID=UPI004059FD75